MRPRGYVRVIRGQWVVETEKRVGGLRTRERIELGPEYEIRSVKAARAAADAYFARIEPQTLQAGKPIRAVEYFEYFMATHAVLLRKTTQSLMRCRLNAHLVPHVGSLRIDEIDARSLQQLIASMAGDYARSSVKGVRDLLLQILRAAQRDGYSAHLIPRAAVPLPKSQTAQAAPRHFSSQDLTRILENSPFPWRALWAVCGMAGLRIGEALGLTWSAVNLTERIVTITQAAVCGELAPLKTHSSRAEVPMTAELAAILTSFQRLWKPNAMGLLFATQAGEPHDSKYVRSRVLHPLLEELGIEHAGTHAFRHGVPKRLDQAGLSPGVIQKIMRHSSLKQTEAYLHVTATDIREAMDAAFSRSRALQDAAIPRTSPLECASGPAITETEKQGLRSTGLVHREGEGGAS